MPSLEHNNKIIGESLVLLKYLDDNFEGPKLLPNVRCEYVFTPCSPSLSLFKFSDFDEQRCEILQDPLKQQFAEELLAYTDTFNKIVYTSFKGDAAKEAGEILNFACSGKLVSE